MDKDIISLAFSRFGIHLTATGQEFHGPCPECGGTDRWIVWAEGNHFCRQCGLKGWLNANFTPSPDHLRLAQEREAAVAAAVQDRLTRWQHNGAKQHVVEYHEALRDRDRAWWAAQGLTELQQDYYLLGYCAHKRVLVEGEQFQETEAYTIPIHSPFSHELVNIQYRLSNPPLGTGKYRQETGLPAAIFYATTRTEGDVLIVEGAKKAAVLSGLVGDSVQVAGLPGICPSHRLLEELGAFRRKWLLPDPDVMDSQLKRFRDRLTQLKVVRFHRKIDDLIIGGLDRNMFRAWLLNARD